MKRAALIGLLLAARAQVGVFVPGPSIGDSRAAHTATVLTDGRDLCVYADRDGEGAAT